MVVATQIFLALSVAELHSKADIQLTSVLGRRRFGELVEDVEVALICDLANHTRFLEEIVVDVRSYRLSLCVEVDLEVLSEA